MLIPNKFSGYHNGTRQLHISSGGGGGGTSTQVNDVPEWARGYAKTALGQASQLTDIDKNPYQTYGNERVAQFTPLQQQSYQGAAAMQAGPQAFQSQVGQYMSPYMQNVVDIQKREAERQSGIAGAQEQAQMARAGAFGGGRDAIMRAERGRNLGTQMNDIQSQGLQSAYTNATNQYNTGQSQNMAINQLQNQYGGQQQQQVQNILGQQYQDFLSQKQYPYQQLEFLSGMVRGTPMGTVSSLYQPPGSALGQVAGLGMGAYGLSQMGMKFAGGGSVDAPENVANIVDGLSDAQLEQAEKAAAARGDVDQLKAIQSEKAMRASERGGMAGAYNSLPYSRRTQMMAGGGMAVAFKKGGDEGENTYFQDPMGTPSVSEGRAPTGSDFVPDFRQNVTEGESYTPGLRGMLFGYDVKKPEAKKEETKADPYKDLPPTRRADFEGGGKQQLSPVIKRGLSELAASKGMSEDDLMNSTKRIMAYFESRSKPEMDKLQAMIDKGSNESKEVKEQMRGKALAQYGFDWAAKASQPGARFLGSASAAAPSISQSVAESQKLAREIEQNQLKLNMSMQQFRIAQSKGDEQAAMNWAQQVRQLKQSEQMLALKQQELGIHAAGIEQKNKQFNAMLGSKMASAMAQNKQAQARLAKVGTDAAFKYDENNRRTKEELIKQHGPVAGEALYRQGRKNYINEAMQSTADSMSDAQSSGGGGGARSVFDLLED
jgi:hypothetical protein